MNASGKIFALVVAITFSSFAPFAVTAVAATNSVANPSNKAPAPKADKKARGMPFHGNVAAVDKLAKSITMTGKKQRVFHLTSETHINKENKPSKLEALAVGDYVGGYAREAPDGKLELVTLNITPQAASAKTGGSRTAK
jgi:hypothetical protein